MVQPVLVVSDATILNLMSLGSLITGGLRTAIDVVVVGLCPDVSEVGVMIHGEMMP